MKTVSEFLSENLQFFGGVIFSIYFIGVLSQSEVIGSNLESQSYVNKSM